MVTVKQAEFWTESALTAEPTEPLTSSREPVYLDETPALEDLFGRPLQTGVNPDATDDRLDIDEFSGDSVDEPMVEEEVEQIAPPPPRPQAFVSRSTYADQPAPSFNMAKFLTLTGSLDSVEEEGRWLELPKGSFHPRVMLSAAKRISRDFLNELRSPPKNHSAGRRHRVAGWMKGLADGQ